MTTLQTTRPSTHSTVLLPAGADILAIREIKRLQHLWAHLADAGQWDDMSTLFTPDGIWTDGQTSVWGREALSRHFEKLGGGSENPAQRLNIRLWLSPVITLSGQDEATGRWHDVAMTGRHDKAADWTGGINVVTYRRVDGAWRIHRMVYHPQFAGPYADGWHHVRETVPPVPFHYTPNEAGQPFGELKAIPSQRDAALCNSLIDAGQVQNLAAAFGFYLDRKAFSDMADLFADEGELHIDQTASYRGREDIFKALGVMFGAEGLSHGELNDRPQLMPVITLSEDGQTARLRNYEIGMIGEHQKDTYWCAVIQTFDMARRASGDWHITRLDRLTRFIAPYEAGWAAGALGADGGQAGPAQYPGAPAPAVTLSQSLFEIGAPPQNDNAPIGETAPQLLKAAMHDAAENISNAYGYYIDEFMWDETADLFSSDGWKELSYIGTYIGREQIRKSLFHRYGNTGRRPEFMAIHQKTQPYVTPSEDGKSAQIRLRLFQFNSQQDKPGSWISGVYENQIVLEDGVWRIHGMDLEYIWLGDYEKGWAGIVPKASERFAPDPEVIRGFPPDACLRGETFAPFPFIRPLGFHFENPVSGRSPETLLNWSDGHFGPPKMEE